MNRPNLFAMRSTDRKATTSNAIFSDVASGERRDGAACLPGTTELTSVLRETCAELGTASGYNGTLGFEAPGGHCVLPSRTATLVVLIVTQAVTNAIKYSHPSGVPGEIRVSCCLNQKDGLVIRVIDDGVGLPDNFDATSKGNSSFRIMHNLSTKLGGALTFKSTGLGLAVTLQVPHARLTRKGEPFGPLAANSINDHQARPATGFDLLEALPVAVYLTDTAGRITFYNEAAAALWGFRPELGKSEFCGSWKLYLPDGRPLPHRECPMAMALAQERPVRGIEAVAERPNGTRVPFIPYPTPLFNNVGGLVGAINMLVDISDRKRAENALARHRDEQSALYQFTDRLFRALSPADAYAAALDAIQHALACPRSSILLFDEAGLMRFVAARGLSDEYRKAVEGHSPWIREEKDPHPIYIDDITNSDLSDTLKAVVKKERIRALAFIPLMARGKLIGKFMTYYDNPHAFTSAELDLAVTIARQLGFGLEQLRADQTSRLLASIIETSSDAIVSKDLNGIVTSWNRGAERMFGYAAEEMVGKSITTLIPADRHSEEFEILRRVRHGERIEHYETVRRHKDGHSVDISLSVSPIMDAYGKVIGASKIGRDITERKEARVRQELLTREIQHRTKNLFAVVQAVVARSFVGKSSVEDAESAVISRLSSLGQTHVMLMDKEWQGADLSEVVKSEMSPYADRVQIEGPSLMLSAKAAQNFALAVHELATNAAKYGALSNTNGRVDIHWSVVPSNGSGAFAFRWQERGGPPVSLPDQRGFGSVVLEQVMAEYFQIEPRIDFAGTGVSYELQGSLDALKPSRHP